MCDLDLSNLLPAQRAKRHKENGRIVGLKDLIEPGGRALITREV
jgi:hypothetical protein